MVKFCNLSAPIQRIFWHPSLPLLKISKILSGGTDHRTKNGKSWLFLFKKIIE